MANSTKFSSLCCSICKSSAATSPANRPPPKTTTAPESNNSRLETSFVNVPYSPPTAYAHPNSTQRKEWHGSEMYEVTRRTEDMLSAMEEMMGRDDGDCAMSDTYYCRSCLERSVVTVAAISSAQSIVCITIVFDNRNLS
eukprot:scaffold5182_cov65-Cyclotella_meneghiniana.AAC.5